VRLARKLVATADQAVSLEYMLGCLLRHRRPFGKDEELP